jgi:hypothetical protein
LVLYVSPAGSEGGTGLTPDSPVTLLEAQEMLPDVADNDCRHVVNLAAGVYGNIKGIHVKGGFEAAVNGVSYRGPAMAARTPSVGPQSATLVSTTELSDSKTRLSFSGANWTADAQLGWFLRITRGDNLVIYEIPAARNGANTIDIDVGVMVTGGAHLASLLQAGDVCEWVKPAVEISSDDGDKNLDSISISGKGAGFWNYDAGTKPGGWNGHTFERISFSTVFSMDAWGVSYDRCAFLGVDHNWLGGNAYFANCTSNGMQFQGGFCVEHDQAGCRADSASSPIYQLLDDPSMELLVTGAFIVGRGGGMSAIGASYLAEKNLSIYGSGSYGLAVYRGSFIANAPAANRNRLVAVQGDGNLTAVRATIGGLIRFNYLPDIQQVTGTSELVIEGESKLWSELLGVLGGNWVTNYGRITTAVLV